MGSTSRDAPHDARHGGARDGARDGAHDGPLGLDACTGDEPHPLWWLTDDFALCCACDLLYVRQPGALVWVHDVWSARLAWCLAEARTERELDRLGVDAADLKTLLEGTCVPDSEG